MSRKCNSLNFFLLSTEQKKVRFSFFSYSRLAQTHTIEAKTFFLLVSRQKFHQFHFTIREVRTLDRRKITKNVSHESLLNLQYSNFVVHWSAWKFIERQNEEHSLCNSYFKLEIVYFTYSIANLFFIYFFLWWFSSFVIKFKGTETKRCNQIWGTRWLY